MKEISMHQSPDHPVPSAKAICKQREQIFVNREKKEKKKMYPLGGVEMGLFFMGLCF